MSDNYKEIVQADLVLVMSMIIKDALLAEMKMHGDDPETSKIVAAAFVKALWEMDKEFREESLEDMVLGTIYAAKRRK